MSIQKLVFLGEIGYYPLTTRQFIIYKFLTPLLKEFLRNNEICEEGTPKKKAGLVLVCVVHR
jgi:hypothetical protein